ncbi:MAG TPA: glycosyltransferase family 2 protein [Kofleriaceae bacterium]|nr:glycosyltransferase family 2 protein [Kofleriaceae bacterium]
MLEIVLAGVAIVAAAYWVFMALASLRTMGAVPLLARLAPREPARWPRVSVIIPACNEEATIEAALRSRLGEGYPDAEYLVIDDRSTDRTGEIIDRLAAEDPRIVVLHVRELPEGWLGKVHALHAAVGRATGAWVLFSDADVHHEPGTLRRVVAHCEQQGIDHVAVFPSVWSSSFWLDGVMNLFLRLLAAGSRAWKVPDPRSRISAGGGNFNLVRRAVLTRAGGLLPLRMEVIDDAALGQMLKWSGARQRVLNARGFVGLSFYSSVRDIVVGMEKNAFAMLGRFDVPRFAVALAALSVCELGPWVVLAAGAGWTFALAAATLALAAIVQLAVARWLGRPLWPTVLAPLGWLTFVFAALRSMVLTLRRGGITWRGTHYPLAALRRGRRYVHA